MPKIELTLVELQALQSLINLMTRSRVIPKEEAAARRKAEFSKVFDRMLETGQTLGQVTGLPDFYHTDEATFRGTLKRQQDDLGFQVDFLIGAFQRWQSVCEIVPPYYAKRVAIILRKAKEKGIELEFLNAWCRHFPNCRSGRTFEELVERRNKLSAVLLQAVSARLHALK